MINVLERSRPHGSAPTTNIRRATIAHLVHGLGVGGAEILVDRIARTLADDHRFVFICLDEVGELGRQLEHDGFVVRHLERRPGIDLACAKRLGRLLGDERVDLVHAHQYTPFLQGMLSRLPIGRLPILFTEHGRHHPDHTSWKRRLVNRVLLGRRDRVVGVGEDVRRALVEIEGLPAHRVGVIHNGIDLAPFDAVTDSTREEVRRELGLAESDFVIVVAARLDPVKDHETSIRAVDRLRHQHPNAKLLVVGDGPERERISDLISELDLGGNVLVLGTRNDVPRLIHAADVGLLTSRSEGIPLFLVESLAAGRPVVSTNVGGTGEVVTDGHDGFLVPAGNVDAVAAALMKLASMPELRADLGERGRVTARTKFCEHGMISAYANLYAEMLG